ncbi:hypothetical protein ACLPJK_25785 [Pseudomonas aeruginosa]|uniref:DUF7208 family protein n=1 Tax=Pseudomonas aeruginosa TaxID=287 RepID=UPI003D272B63
MVPIRPTMFGGFVQTCAHGNRPFRLYPYTTLNEKLKFLDNAQLQPGQMPSLGYWAIGDMGHRVVTVNQRAKIKPVDHLPDHAALYNQCPFVMRPSNDDLPPELRRLYAGRVEMTHTDGRNYVQYWLKRLVMDNVIPTMNNNILNPDGTWGVEEYVTDSDNLNPTWPEIEVDSATTTTGNFTSSSMVIPIAFTKRDVDEYLRVATILYGSEDEAVISEIAFCTGVDRQISIATPSGSVNFMEAAAVQIDTFCSAYYQLVFENEGFEFAMEMGVSDPLLGAQQYNGAAVVGVTGLKQP